MERTLRLMLTALITAALAYAGLCAAMFAFQRSFIYFPQAGASTPAVPVIELPIDAGAVRVTTRPMPGPNALLYFGGNAEDVAYSLGDLSTAFPDHAIYLMNYRGYGGSAGAPSEAALVADALALFDHARNAHSHIVVVGRSLGSGVAVQLASRRPVARLVLVTPYDSLLRLAQRRFPFLPAGWLMLDRFESWRHAKAVAVPTLLIAAEHDEVIPRAHADALLPHFRAGIATLKVLPDAGHNTISAHADYLPLLRGFR